MKPKIDLLGRLHRTTEALASLDAARDATAKARLAALRQAFHESGLRQREIVAASGLPQANVSKWLNGRAEPSPATIDALCRAIEEAVRLRQETDR